MLSLVPLGLSFATAATAGSHRVALAATTPLVLQGGMALRALAGGFSKPSMVAAIELAPLWLAATLVALTV